MMKLPGGIIRLFRKDANTYKKKDKDRKEKTVNISSREYHEMKEYIQELEQILDSNIDAVERMKSNFLQNICHEIRTPLNAVLGFTSLLVHVDVPDNKKKEYLRRIKSGSTQFLRTMDKLIDASLIESGQLELEYERISLQNLMYELHEYIADRCIEASKSQSKLDIVVDIDPQFSDLFIKTDKYRLQQVFHNLIDNALSNTYEGYIKIGYRKINEKNVLFFVKDTGSGIQIDTDENIFDHFVRLRTENENFNERGLGLGLSIAKGILQLMDGEIWMEPNQTTGTIFNFVLPTENKIISPVKNKTGRKKENVITNS